MAVVAFVLIAAGARLNRRALLKRRLAPERRYSGSDGLHRASADLDRLEKQLRSALFTAHADGQQGLAFNRGSVP